MRINVDRFPFRPAARRYESRDGNIVLIEFAGVVPPEDRESIMKKFPNAQWNVKDDEVGLRDELLIEISLSARIKVHP